MILLNDFCVQKLQKLAYNFKYNIYKQEEKKDSV